VKGWHDAKVLYAFNAELVRRSAGGSLGWLFLGGLGPWHALPEGFEVGDLDVLVLPTFLAMLQFIDAVFSDAFFLFIGFGVSAFSDDSFGGPVQTGTFFLFLD
jgi:hypothetical protein